MSLLQMSRGHPVVIHEPVWFILLIYKVWHVHDKESIESSGRLVVRVLRLRLSIFPSLCSTYAVLDITVSWVALTVDCVDFRMKQHVRRGPSGNSLSAEWIWISFLTWTRKSNKNYHILRSVCSDDTLILWITANSFPIWFMPVPEGVSPVEWRGKDKPFSRDCAK
jgi:hypothetical protein